MFSILRWTPHHWVLFLQVKGSLAPRLPSLSAACDYRHRRVPGHQHHKLHCPGSRAGKKKVPPPNHGSMERLLGVHWRYPDIPNIFQPEVDEGTHFPLPGVCFLGHVCSCRSKICRPWPWQHQDSLDFCLNGGS